MQRSEGCRLWDADGNQYVDMIMALGAVALGYAHPRVVAAASNAARAGSVGSLPPTLELAVAERLAATLPGVESVRFFKSGAEAVAAAVRIARVYTGREHVITCGYHGWLDWCQAEAGVPHNMTQLRTEVPFNDCAALQRAVDEHDSVAAIVLEPVVDGPPDVEWLATARDLANRSGAVLVLDEIKTALRLAAGGVAERYGVVPHLTVIGKALGNGYPIAATCGSRDVMHAATRTWISSTLATEFVSLAAALAVLDVFGDGKAAQHLSVVGSQFMEGLDQLARDHPAVAQRVRGIPQMCYLQFASSELAHAVTAGAARRGVLFKPSAYNFVSLAHTDHVIQVVLQQLDQVISEVEAAC
jgi:glutamate-1-semialdehyde 2,1-aminomutase